MEFQGVMAPGGFALITCPDLQSVAALIAANKLLEPAPARHIPGWGR
ncbi:MAG: hypothetical protein NTW02_03890 [Cyanobium sp. LacPavin_0920_WC12_MAG_62_9]|nr:hypothetical protein [Cyanobium sp. LacPavin_0920_WC12_MAG_62_9]